jgi:hypothetical protein
MSEEHMRNRIDLSSRRSDGLEFEVTSFDAARASMDELPAGLKAASARSDAADSTFRRKPLAARDRVLSTEAWNWLEALPSDVRPKALALQFPHVVNQVALIWASGSESLRYLRNLMVDQRGGRRGFPMAVADELAKLYEWREKALRDAD